MPLTSYKNKVCLLLLFLAISSHVLADNTVESPFNKTQLESLASIGDRNAQFRLGLYYDSFASDKEAAKRSLYWYIEAARQGHTLAQYNLGVKFMLGEGVAKDPNKALSLWLQAANEGHVQAQFNVGRAYFLGVGLEKNHPKAEFWFKKAAEQGDPKATDILTRFGSEESGLQESSIQEFESEKKMNSGEKNVENATVKISKPSQETKNLERKLNKLESPIDVYTGPNAHNHFMYQLPNHKGLSIIDTRGQNWFKVSRSPSLPIWVHQNYVIQDAQDAQNGIIKDESVRARGLPGNVSGSILGFFQQGEKIVIHEKKENWYRVSATTNFNAWVKRSDWKLERNK